MAKLVLRRLKTTLVESLRVPGARNPGPLATWSEGTPELPLILSLVAEAFLQLLASGLGTLALVWATVVLLGGYSTTLATTDFWFTTAIVFVEIARIVGYNSAPEAKFFVDVPAAFYQLKQGLPVASATNIVRVLAIGSTWIALPPIFLATAGMSLSIIRIASIGGRHCYERGCKSGNLKPALILFYGLVLAQGALFLLWLAVAVNRTSSVETLTKKYWSWWQLLLQQQQKQQQRRLQRQLQQLQQQPQPQPQQQWLEQQWLEQRLRGRQEQRLRQQRQQLQDQRQQLQDQELLQYQQLQEQWLLPPQEQGLQGLLQGLRQWLRQRLRQRRLKQLERRLKQLEERLQLLPWRTRKNLPRILIDRYVNSIAETCIQKGVASTINSTLVSFAAELLLQSDDQDDHSSAVVILHSLIVTDTERSGRAAEQIYSSDKLVDKLLWMLRSNNPVTKVCIAEIVVELASNCELRLVDIPGGARCISSLLDPHFMKKEEETKFFVRGLEILGKLASDPENCREIYNTIDLVPKIIAPLRLYKVIKDKDDAMTVKIVRESLRVVDKLTSGTGESSRNLCRELTDKYSRSCRAAENILWILRNSVDQEMRVLAVKILSRLTLDESIMDVFTAQLRYLLFKCEDDSPLGIEAGKALDARGDEFADIKQLETIMSGDKYSKEYRTVFAEMLAQIFANPSERSSQLYKRTDYILSEALFAIVTGTKDITNLDNSNRKFLASFLGLAVQIREKGLVTAQEFAAAVPGLSTGDDSFAEKLMWIIEVMIKDQWRILGAPGEPSPRPHPASAPMSEDEDCLAIMKSATKLVRWMMEIDDNERPGYYIEYFQRCKIVEKLNAVVKAMAHLERYMVMTGGAEEIEHYVTLQTLVEIAKNKLVPQQQPQQQEEEEEEQQQPPPLERRRSRQQQQQQPPAPPPQQQPLPSSQQQLEEEQSPPREQQEEQQEPPPPSSQQEQEQLPLPSPQQQEQPLPSSQQQQEPPPPSSQQQEQEQLPLPSPQQQEQPPQKKSPPSPQQQEQPPSSSQQQEEEQSPPPDQQEEEQPPPPPSSQQLEQLSLPSPQPQEQEQKLPQKQPPPSPQQQELPPPSSQQEEEPPPSPQQQPPLQEQQLPSSPPQKQKPPPQQEEQQI